MTVGLLSVVAPSLADGGSAGAPNGTIPFPRLLDVNSPGTQTHGRTLTARPSFNVPGVDYAVGIDNSRLPLKDPNTILSTLSGISGNNTTQTVTVTGNNAVLDGYDFSLNNGWKVLVTAGSGAIISNNNFLNGSNKYSNAILISNTASNVTITQNVINGNGNGSVGQGLIGSNGKGTTTITYNYVYGAYAEPLVLGTNTADTDQSWVIQYNVIGNAGMAWPNSHGDWIQTSNGSGGSTGSMTWNNNLLFQFALTTSETVGPRTQGLSFWSAGGNAGNVQNYSCQNNVAIGTGVTPGNNGGPYVSYQYIVIPKNLVGNAVVKNNWFDSTLYIPGNANVGGCAFWFGSDFGSGTGSQGVQSGTVNGIFPPSSLFTDGGLPAGNTDIATGNLLTSGNNVHLGTS